MSHKNHDLAGGAARSVGFKTSALRDKASTTYTKQAEYSRAEFNTPINAAEIKVGNCILGYIHNPRRPGHLGTEGLLKLRVHHMERVIKDRYGPGCRDTKMARRFARVAAHTLPNASHIPAWCRIWTPELPQTEVTKLVDEVMQGRRKFKADTIAKILQITPAERERLKLWSLGAVGFGKAKRATARKQRDAARKKARRDVAREKDGKQTREQWEATSKSAFCRELRISRDTLYRWERAGMTPEQMRTRAANRTGGVRTIKKTTSSSSIYAVDGTCPIEQGADPSAPSSSEFKSSRAAISGAEEETRKKGARDRRERPSSAEGVAPDSQTHLQEHERWPSAAA